MGKKLMLIGTFATVLVFAYCGGGAHKENSGNYSSTDVEHAQQVMSYYTTAMALLNNVVVEKDVNAVLTYMEQGVNAPTLTAIAPPAFSQKDSAFIVNPGPYFSEEIRKSLKQNFYQLFKVRRKFYTLFDRYITYLKSNDKAAADNLLPQSYELSEEMSEYKESIMDTLYPLTDDAQKILFNDNPMKEQLLAMKRMDATMQSIIALCKRKPAPNMARLEMKMAKLVIQLDIARHLPAIEGQPEETKSFHRYLENVEEFIKDVQHIKTKGSYDDTDMAMLDEYAMSLN